MNVACRKLLVSILFSLFLGIPIVFSANTHLPPPTLANKVAHLEANMWRSYYANKKIKLFLQLKKLLQIEFNMSSWQAFVTAYNGTKAAFIFKLGDTENEYNKALPYLEKFYSNINKTHQLHFGSKKAAQLELAWWIVHREHNKPALENKLIELQATIYQLSPAQLKSHVQYRIRAMLLRDKIAEQRKLTEQDWQEVEGLLRQSWQALYYQIVKD